MSVPSVNVDSSKDDVDKFYTEVHDWLSIGLSTYGKKRNPKEKIRDMLEMSAFFNLYSIVFQPRTQKIPHLTLFHMTLRRVWALQYTSNVFRTSTYLIRNGSVLSGSRHLIGISSITYLPTRQQPHNSWIVQPDRLGYICAIYVRDPCLLTYDHNKVSRLEERDFEMTCNIVYRKEASGHLGVEKRSRILSHPNAGSREPMSRSTLSNISPSISSVKRVDLPTNGGSIGKKTNFANMNLGRQDFKGNDYKKRANRKPEKQRLLTPIYFMIGVMAVTVQHLQINVKFLAKATAVFYETFASTNTLPVTGSCLAGQILHFNVPKRRQYFDMKQLKRVLCRLVLPAQANYQSWLMRDDPRGISQPRCRFSQQTRVSVATTMVQLGIARLTSALTIPPVNQLNSQETPSYFMTAIRTGGLGAEGISALLIPRSEGLRTRPVPVIARSLSATTYVMFEDVKEGNGFRQTMRETFNKKLVEQPVVTNKFSNMGQQQIIYELEHPGDADGARLLGGTTALLKVDRFIALSPASPFLMGRSSIVGGSEDVLIDLSIREALKLHQQAEKARLKLDFLFLPSPAE
ncbi:uncharacterized protein BDR25DRAFT_353351 [Lindgomyces ingoldianus]|uniref:Uncharacterized protein n=1 Tax=Lindgomyces ingoldianus TaxID=673940 RepID=A0ACB6R1W3_9PLEO|nr:uncharacterized protein BDR25DRAFT_353351 [Lindgomyces ingoldianus]KAF2472325.1 hypothetical protein BDR25DRAFT_353351 [Lindgomyces ingoldianus]